MVRTAFPPSSPGSLRTIPLAHVHRNLQSIRACRSLHPSLWHLGDCLSHIHNHHHHRVTDPPSTMMRASRVPPIEIPRTSGQEGVFDPLSCAREEAARWKSGEFASHSGTAPRSSRSESSETLSAPHDDAVGEILSNMECGPADACGTPEVGPEPRSVDPGEHDDSDPSNFLSMST